MDNRQALEEQLLQRILEVQRYDPITESSMRKKTLQRFLWLLDQHREFYRPVRSRIPQSLQGAYREICDEAQNILLSLIHREIDNYDPKRASVLGWVQFYMNRRCLHEAIKMMEDPLFVKSLKRLKSGSKQPPWKRENFIVNDQYQDGREEIPQFEETPFVSEQIRQVLEADPSGKFKAEHVRGNPNANFQVLALRIYEQLSWEELAEELGEKVPTLSGFFQRNLKKFAPYIREYICEHL